MSPPFPAPRASSSTASIDRPHLLVVDKVLLGKLENRNQPAYQGRRGRMLLLNSLSSEPAVNRRGVRSSDLISSLTGTD